MNFGISQEIDVEAQEKSSVIIFLSDKLKGYLSDRDYGQDVQNIFIGCICVKPREGYEEWFKIRKPRYKAIDKIKLLDGNTVELIGVYGYDIKLNFDEFVSATETESRKILAQEILNSLSNLDALPKKVKDFDKEKFKSDMEQFLRNTI